MVVVAAALLPLQSWVAHTKKNTTVSIQFNIHSISTSTNGNATNRGTCRHSPSQQPLAAPPCLQVALLQQRHLQAGAGTP